MTSKRPGTEKPPKVDPITLEIIRYGLQSIPDEIEADIARTAYSPLVYEYKDYAVGMVAPNGETIAQCRGGIPLFLANALGDGFDDNGEPKDSTKEKIDGLTLTPCAAAPAKKAPAPATKKGQ